MTFAVAFVPTDRALLRPTRLISLHVSLRSSRPLRRLSPLLPRRRARPAGHGSGGHTRPWPPGFRSLRVPAPAFTMVAGDAGSPPPPSQPPPSLPYARDFQLLLDHPVTETAVGMLVLLTCAVVALETLPLDELSVRLLSGVERIANVVFFVEYLLRFYSLNCRPRVLLRKLMIIDFVACLPLFFAPTEGWALQASQLLRVARVLRLQRAIEREDFTKLFTRNKNRRGSRAPAVVVSESQLKAAQIILTVFTLLYATSSLLYAAENQVNPEFSNFFESFYFSVVAYVLVFAFAWRWGVLLSKVVELRDRGGCLGSGWLGCNLDRSTLWAATTAGRPPWASLGNATRVV